jgi:diaminopimelate decarboxylase
MLAPAPSGPDPTIPELIAQRSALSLHAADGLVIEDVPLAAIAAELGTPCWVISAGCIRTRLRRLQTALAGLDARIHYAIKANDHLAILRLVGGQGAGADVVSGGELARALHAGIPPARIVFSGVGKTRAEIGQAIGADIAQLNVESAEELARISAIASAMGRTARVALRINPDVDAGTHAKITTGLAENKFGIAWEDAAALYAHAAALPGLHPVGLAVHIGSQISSVAPYASAFALVAELVVALRQAGHQVARVDCGGGLGIAYRDEPEASPAAFAGVVRTAFAGLDVALSLEPGRWLVGPAGVLLSTVILEKYTAGRRFTVLDAAMNDLIRPAMYDAWHGIVPIGPAAAVAPCTPTDIVGPVCETGDTFARDRLLPVLGEDAVVAILDAGAYGSVMSSTYNARPLAAQALVDGAQWSTIRPRQAVPDLWATELLPAPR